MSPKANTRIAARYLPMLAPMISKEASRYYLNGVYIEPHPVLPGVLAVATNGHILAVVYDKDGRADKGGIFPVSRELLASAKRHASQARFNGEVVELFAEQNKKDKDALKPELRVFIGLSEEIDGTYPDWRRVLTKPGPASAEAVSFNPIYLTALSAAAKGSPVTFRAADAASPAFFRPDSTPEFFAIIMPMRLSDNACTIPNWLAEKAA